MAFRGLAWGLLFSLFFPFTVNAGKNCASPHVRVIVLVGEVRDRNVQYEAVITSDTNPPYATTTLTVAVGTLTTTRTESKSVTQFSLDSGCVVSSGSSIYTLTAPTSITQEGTNPVSFWDPLTKPLGTRSIQKFAPKQTGTRSSVDPNKFRDYGGHPV